MCLFLKYKIYISYLSLLNFLSYYFSYNNIIHINPLIINEYFTLENIDFYTHLEKKYETKRKKNDYSNFVLIF